VPVRRTGAYRHKKALHVGVYTKHTVSDGTNLVNGDYGLS